MGVRRGKGIQILLYERKNCINKRGKTSRGSEHDRGRQFTWIFSSESWNGGKRQQGEEGKWLTIKET